MKFSIVIPAHNEEENITEVIHKIENSLKMPHELIVVNDHSIDATKELVEKLRPKYSNLKLIDNEYPKGFANAIKSGFASIQTDVVVPIMGDLCDDLGTIEKMVEKINQGYDVVCGARYIKGGARMGGSRVKGFFSCFVGRSLYLLLGLPTQDIANAFKMYRRRVIESVKIEASGFEISMEIPLKAYYSGFKIAQVPTVWRERTKGKSSFKMLKILPSYLKLYLWAIYKRLSI